MTPEQPGALKRDIGLVGLCFVSVSGMLGAGWLFAPLLVSQEAGPAALVSWILGGFMILLITLTFAEVSAMLPIAGGIARLPHFSYGNVVSMVMGFTAWVGYCTNAPISTLVMLQYTSDDLPWLYHVDAQDHSLSLAGIGVAALLMMVMVVINIVGVKALATWNTGITWIKIVIPLAVSGAIIALQFDADNFTAHGGFAPYGIEGILAGVATGGVIFAFTGFRHAIDLAGETRNPSVNIPLALTISVCICIAIYGFVQFAFIGAIPSTDLTHGWSKLSFGHNLGPFAQLALSLGLVWVGVVIYGGSLIAPFGGALVSTGSNARLALALSRNGFLFPYFDFISRKGVPVRTLLLNYVLGMLIVLFLQFDDMVTLQTATIALSFCVGPLCVYAFRTQLPKRPRGFSVPLVGIVAPVAFICSVWVLYWAGWRTMGHLGVALLAGGVLFAARCLLDRSILRDMDLVNAVWIVPLLIGIAIISYLGNFGGGLGLIPFGLDLLLCLLLALGVFALAYRSRLPNEKVRAYLASENLDEAS